MIKSFTEQMRCYQLTQIYCDPKISGIKKAIYQRVLILTFPVFHFIDTCYHSALLLNVLLNNRKIGKGCSTEESIKLAHSIKSHFIAIFTSLPMGLWDPVSSLNWGKNKPIPSRGVTYTLMPYSRLGDNLICYFNAKWIEYKYNLPLVFREFPHAYELALGSNQHYEIPVGHPVEKLKQFSLEEFKAHQEESIVWRMPFYMDSNLKTNEIVNIDWNDSGFRELILKDLTLVNEATLPPLIPGRCNIALHLRTGGTFDAPGISYWFPVKVPPRAFYEESLKIALREYKDKPVHIQIFTDSIDPAKDLHSLRVFISPLHRDVTIDTAAQPNATEGQVTTDMIAMSRYEGLIRPDSALSTQSSLLGKPLFEITPRSYTVCKKKITLEGFCIIRREKEDQKVVKENEIKIQQPIVYTCQDESCSDQYFQDYHRKIIGDAGIL